MRDSLTDEVMLKNEPWGMCHKHGYEFRKHRKSAGLRNIDRVKFLDEHNNPNQYRAEKPNSNRSHYG